MHCIAVRPGEDTSIQREDSQLLLSLHSLRTPTPAVWRPLRLLPTLRSRYVLGCPLSCNVRHQQLDATLAPSPLWEHDSPRLRRSIAHPSRNTARALSTPRAAVLAPRDPRRLLYRSSTQHSLYVYTRALLAEHYPKAIIDDTSALNIRTRAHTEHYRDSRLQLYRSQQVHSRRILVLHDFRSAHFLG